MSPPPPDSGSDGPLSPLRRPYTAPTGGRTRDAFESAQSLKIALWSLVGVGLGLMAGLMAGHPFVGALSGGVVMYLVVQGLVGSAGAAAGTLHAPSGSNTPHAREHSHAESLVVRGYYREAVEVFEKAIAEEPADPTPYLRVARIQRDDLGDLEAAARWFRRALREPELTPGREALARRELVELYVHRMGEAARATPELARMAEELAGTEDGEWAARELARIKAAMRED